MEASGFFNAEQIGETYDREYLAESFANYFSKFIGNGIFPNPSTNLQVLSDEGRYIILNQGSAWINGYWYENQSQKKFLLDVADGVLNRIDAVVIKYDVSDRAISARIVKGTPAVSPEKYIPKRDADVYELVVAYVAINKGAISIIQANITDTRLDNNLCGIVTQAVKTIDTTTLYNQIKSDLDKFQVEEKQQFLIWFETIKDILDEETATHLFNLINEHITNKQIHNAIFTQSKTNNVINLTGDMPLSGIVSGKFTAKNANLEGDEFTINGIAYSAKPTGEATNLSPNSFITGDTVSIDINIDTKKISFSGGSGGGGSGKMMQQVSLPISDKYNGQSTASEWAEFIMSQVKGNGAPSSFVFDEERNCLWFYCSSATSDGTISNSINQLFLSDYSLKVYTIPDINVGAGTNFFGLFLYKGDLYAVQGGVPAANDFSVRKINLDTLSTTTLLKITIKYVAMIFSMSEIVQLRDNIFAFTVTETTTTSAQYTTEIMLFDMLTLNYKGTNIIMTANMLNKYIARPLIQYYPKDDQLVVVVNPNGSAATILNSFTLGLQNVQNLIVAVSGSVSLGSPFGSMALNNLVNGVAYAPFGDMTMCVLLNAAGIVGGKKVFLIDLRTGVMDTDTVKPDVPSWYSPQHRILAKVGNKYFIQTNSQFASLDAYPVPPENKARVAKIFKGQEVNTQNRDIQFLSLESKGQPAFSLTTQTWIADRDYDIHLDQYSLKGQPEPILIVGG